MFGRRRARPEPEIPRLRVVDLRDAQDHDLAMVVDPFRSRLSRGEPLADVMSLELVDFHAVARPASRGNHPLWILTDGRLKVTAEDAEVGGKLQDAAAPAEDEDTDMPTAKTPDAPRVVARKHVDDPELRRQMRETYDQLGRDLARSERGDQPSQRTRVRL